MDLKAFKKKEDRGKAALQSLLTLERGTRDSFSNQVSLLQVYTTTPFHKNNVCPRDITYSPCSLAVGGFVNPRGIVILFLNYFEHNGYLRIMIGCIWRKEGVEKGLVAGR